MLNIASRIIAAMCVGISLIIISKTILNSKTRIFNIKSIIMLIIFIIITIFSSTVEYSPLASVLSYLSMIIIDKIIFDLRLSKAVITVGVILVFYMLSDIIVWLALSTIVGESMIRTNTYIFIVSNIMVSIIAVCIFLIPQIKQKTILFLSKIDNNKIYDKILFFILVFIVLILIMYNISNAAKLSKTYMIDVIVMFMFFIIAFIFLNERNNRDKLNDEYDKLMEYVYSFENWIEEEQINKHEHKNQLAVIRNMSDSNGKIKKYIDEILKDNIKTEDSWFNEINNLPSGGIKGLLYYKLILTKKENIEICLSVSEDSKKLIKNIEGEELKNISRLLGIYLDNAIEATKNVKKKMISIEIYPINSNLNIVISNTYDGHIDLKKINNKGYSTKGKGHGKGLYFANKIIKKSPVLNSEIYLINEYYVNKLIIDKSKEIK